MPDLPLIPEDRWETALRPLTPGLRAAAVRRLDAERGIRGTLADT